MQRGARTSGLLADDLPTIGFAAILFAGGAVLVAIPIDWRRGFDVRFRVANEDADISKRLWEQGGEVHFLAQGRCTSFQKDTLRSLANKQLRDSS